MPHSLSTPATVPQPTLDAKVVPEHLAVPVVVVDATGMIHYRNISARNFLDASSLREFMHQGATQQYIIRSISYGAPMEWSGGFPNALIGKYRIHCAPLPGSQPLAIIHFTPLSLESGGEPHDVSRRLASLGKLASRVAHELNNPLDGILRYINLALRVAGDAPESRLTAYLSESRSGLLRMIRIIGDLLEFSRNSDAGFEDVAINELIDQAIHACSQAAEANRVIIAADFQNGELPSVRGPRIYQICCNLIRNAIDAMPDGGRLSITSGLIDDCVVIRVSDTGAGLPQPPERVFEPFYTTKPPGKGTGLGLAICKELVEDMNGTICAENVHGGGAVFILRIPLAGLQGPQHITPNPHGRAAF